MSSRSQIESSSEMEGSSCRSYKRLSQEELCAALVEKECELECAQDQLQSLLVYEGECGRKDKVMKELRKELAAYKQNSHSKDINYVTMEEHLSACENHLQLKTSQMNNLTLEVESWKEKASSADSRLEKLGASTSKISALKKELSTKASEMLKQTQEILQLKKQHQMEKENCSSLRHRMTELQANMSSLQSKMQQTKSSNDDLKLKLSRSECERERLLAAEQKGREEMGRLKSAQSNGRLAQAKQDFLEAEVERTKARESELAIQLGKIKEEFSTMCQEVVSITTQVLPPTDEEHDPVEAVEMLTRQYLTSAEQLDTTQTQLGEAQTALSDVENVNATLEILTQLLTEFKCGLGPSEPTQSPFDTLSTALNGLYSQGTVDNSQSLISVLQESVTMLSSELVTKRVQLVAEIDRHCLQLELSCEERWKEPVEKLALLTERLQSQMRECQELRVRLCEVEEGHQREVAAMKQNETERVKRAIHDSLASEREVVSQKIAALQQQLEAEKQEAVVNERRQCSTLSEQLAATKELLLVECNENDTLKAEKAGLEAKLVSLEVAMNEAHTTAEVTKELMRTQLMQEMIGCREQSHQHALTIVALEEKLLASMEACKRLKGENEILSQAIRGSADKTKEESRIEKLTLLTDTLRHQLSLASDASTKSQARIKRLDSDLYTIRNQIKDREALIVQQFQEQQSDLELTLSKQEATLTGQKSEIAHLQSALLEKTSLVAATDTEKRDTELKLAETRRKLDKLMHSSDPRCRDLVETGQRCTGEKHAETIANQRRALSQLREYIEQLELAKPPVGSHQATLKELSRVRHELLKAQVCAVAPPVQAQSDEEKAFILPSMESEQERVGKIKELESSVSTMRDIVQASERTYKQLAEVICRNMADVTGPSPHSMTEGGEEERQDILKGRKKFAEAVLRRFKTLRLKTSNGVTPGSVSLRSDEGLPEEGTKVVILQTALDGAREELEEQRRLNQALIKRSVFKGNQMAESKQRPHHKCIK